LLKVVVDALEFGEMPLPAREVAELRHEREGSGRTVFDRCRIEVERRSVERPLQLVIQDDCREELHGSDVADDGAV
jgi:hypothetical protein